MEWKLLVTVFASVFVAEMADKTQLVTMLFAADRDVSKWTVFFGSASALVLTSAIGVLAGALLANKTEFVDPGLFSWHLSGELLVMVILGTLIGLIPAQRAVSIKPIDALREE